MIASLSQSVCSRGSTLDDTRIQYSKSIFVNLKLFFNAPIGFLANSSRSFSPIALAKLSLVLPEVLIVNRESRTAENFQPPCPASTAEPTFKTENGQLRNRSFVAILSRQWNSGDFEFAKTLRILSSVLENLNTINGQTG